MGVIDDFKKDLENSDTEYFEKAKEWEERFNGKVDQKDIKGRSNIKWRLIKKQARTLIANISKPYITIKKIASIDPVRPTDSYKSKIIEELINYYWRNFDRIQFIKNLTNEMVIKGTAFIRVGWLKNTKKIEYTLPITTPQIVIDKLISRGFIVENIGNELRVLKEKKIINKPLLEVVNYNNVYIDKDAKKLEDAKFIIIKEEVTKKDLFEYGFNKDEIKNFFINANRADRFNIGDEKKEEIYLYEYYRFERIDDEYKLVLRYIVEKDGNYKVLKKVVEPFAFDGYQLIEVPLLSKAFEVRGDALAEDIKDEQSLMTAIVRGVVDNITSANYGQTFIKTGAMSESAKRDYISGAPIIEVATTGDIRQAIQIGNFNAIPASIFNLLEIVERQSEGITGISRIMQGIAGSEINSPATNFKAMTSQSEVRLLDFAENINNALTKALNKIAQMIGVEVDINDIKELIGIDINLSKEKEKERLLQQYNFQELDEDTQRDIFAIVVDEVEDMFDLSDAKHDIKITINTDGQKLSKIQNINMLMQNAANLIEAGAITPNVIKLLVASLAKNLDEIEVSELILKDEPQVSPFAEQQVQLELMLKQAEAQKEAALAENAKARAELVKVKALKEAKTVELDIASKAQDLAKKVKEMKGEQDDRREQN